VLVAARRIAAVFDGAHAAEAVGSCGTTAAITIAGSLAIHGSEKSGVSMLVAMTRVRRA
jgi:hypothetical protein